MTNTNCSINSQSENSNKSFIRRLDYIDDCMNGTSFDIIPSLLSKAYLAGEMPEPKFKLILLCMHHSSKFQIWRTTLEKTVSKASLKKYLPELIDEGYIEIEAIPTGRGGAVKNVYHVRSVEHWAVYRDHASPNGSPLNGSPLNGSPTLDITKPTSNKTKENQINENFLPSDESDVRTDGIKSNKQTYSEHDEKLARKWADWTKVKSDIDKWANEIRLIKETTKWDNETTEWVLNWIAKDSFWQTVCLSPMQLRKKGTDGVTKLDKIRANIRRNRN